MHTTNLAAFRRVAKILVLGFAAKALIVAAIYGLMSTAPRFASILT
jgi:hypothetical protein